MEGVQLFRELGASLVVDLNLALLRIAFCTETGLYYTVWHSTKQYLYEQSNSTVSGRRSLSLDQGGVVKRMDELLRPRPDVWLSGLGFEEPPKLRHPRWNTI